MVFCRAFALFLLLLLPLLASLSQDVSQCQPRSFGHDSVVCVCDSSHCDQPGSVTPSLPRQGHHTRVTSSREGLRFDTRAHVPNAAEGGDEGEEEFVVVLASASPQQIIQGFGSSFTDSATINIDKLSKKTQDALLRSYFAPEGLEYELVRVPIGGCDFSLRPYTYNDEHEGDTELKHFKLAEEDHLYKIPMLRRAREIAQRPLKILASPWSPPAWMKTNRKINETGNLLREMWQPWADYLIKFIKEYDSAGLPLWGMTTQNHAFVEEEIKWNSLNWPAEDMANWIHKHLGPSLRKAGLNSLKVLVGDDTRDKIDQVAKILGHTHARKYVSGVALHWYKDFECSPAVLDHLRLLFPDSILLYSEACVVQGEMGGRAAVDLGSWNRAELYAKSILQNMAHHVAGWTDWNMALDTTGGPNWAHNAVDAPVIINHEADEFYKQPMFYIMGHFSKFVPGGSVYVPSWVETRTQDCTHDVGAHTDLHTAAFLRPDGIGVVQLLNTGESKLKIRLEGDEGALLHTSLPPKSIQTLLFHFKGSEEGNDNTSEGYCDAHSCP